MGQLGGRGLARSEQITGRERDRIAVRLRERYEQGATIRDLVAQTGRSYGWVRTLLLEADVVLRGRGGDHREHGSTTQHPNTASQVPAAGARMVMNRPPTAP